MRKILVVAFALAVVGACSGAWAKDSVGQIQCKEGLRQCEGNCGIGANDASRKCSEACQASYQRCSKLDGRIDIRGTPAGAVLPGSIKIKAGAVSGTNAAVFESQGSVSPKGVIAAPAATITTTINAPPMSAPVKPPTNVQNGMSGHAMNGQPGRSNFRAQ